MLGKRERKKSDILNFSMYVGEISYTILHHALKWQMSYAASLRSARSAMKRKDIHKMKKRKEVVN